MNYTIQTVREKLATNQKWVEGAIVKLYDFQTADEQQGEYTTSKNNIGFNAFDAKTLSYYAIWLKSGKCLSGKYLANAYKLMPKYAGQILTCINNKVEDQILQDEIAGDSHYCQEEANAMLQN